MIAAWRCAVHVWRQVKLHWELYMLCDFAPEAGELKALQVQRQDVWRLLDHGAALSAHELLVGGTAILIVPVQDLCGTVVVESLLDRLASANHAAVTRH